MVMPVANEALEPEMTLKLEESARVVGCHPTTLRRRIKSGELPAFKIFGRFRIRREDLKRLVQDGGEP